MDWEKTYRHESGGEGNATDQKNNNKKTKTKKTGVFHRRPRCSQAGGEILLTWPSTCLHRLVPTANPSLKNCARPHVEHTNRKPRSGTAGLAL